MFENVKIRSNWNIFFRENCRLKLLSFKLNKTPIWEEFLADQRKYWDADNPNKKRLKLYFGDTDTEANFIKKTEEGFLRQLEYSKLWKGLCNINDYIELVKMKESKDIVLTKKWCGSVRDNEDLVIELWQEKTFIRQHVKYFCDIYKSGTLQIEYGGPDHIMGGAKPGYHKVWNSFGRGITVNFEASSNLFKLDDAVFEKA
jgi:hypothetical protein